MSKSLNKNYIYNLIYQLLVLILPLITTPYLSRILGAENIGIYSYTLSISTYFILFGSLGIAIYGQRQIAYEQEKRKKYSKTFWEIVIVRFITMGISMLIFYFIFVKGNQYQMYYKILLLELLANCFDISWFFQGLEEFKKIVIRNTIIKLISIMCIFIFVKAASDLVIYYVIYVASVLLGNISLWLYLPKYLKNVKVKQLNIGQHIKPVIQLFLPQIAIQIYTVLDKTMIGTIVLNKSEVGYYEQSQKIVKVLITIVTSLGTVMLPRIANTFINGEKEKMKSYINKSFNYVFLLAFPMIFGIILLSSSFVPIFFGQGYDKVSELMIIISPIILLIGMSGVIGTQYLLPTQKQREYTISVICGAIVNFLINLMLIFKYGAIGASIATVIAELIVTSIQLFVIRKEFKIKKILILMKNYLISAIVMFVICSVIGIYMRTGIYSIIVQIFVGMIVYASTLLILKDQLIIETFNNVKEKIKNR